jgi:CheY-like chemotaxis protein
VTLPLMGGAGEESGTEVLLTGAIPAAQVSSGENLTGLRVLVVDDDPDALELFSVALALNGAEVKVGARAREALKILDRWLPDVLVSDIGMPGEDGYALISELRARPAEPGGLIPALALTGFASDNDATRAREAGFQMHVPKPVEPDNLIALVASLVRLAGDRSAARSLLRPQRAPHSQITED